MLAKEMKPGAVVVSENAPVLIEGVSVQSPSARGAATLYKFRGRDLITRQKVDFVLKGTDNLPEADFHKRVVKMMYKDAEAVHLLSDGERTVALVTKDGETGVDPIVSRRTGHQTPIT